MATQQTTIVGEPAKCDEACSELMADGWTLHCVVPLGEFFRSNHPSSGPQPYLAYVMTK